MQSSSTTVDAMIFYIDYVVVSLFQDLTLDGFLFNNNVATFSMEVGANFNNHCYSNSSLIRANGAGI